MMLIKLQIFFRNFLCIQTQKNSIQKKKIQKKNQAKSEFLCLVHFQNLRLGRPGNLRIVNATQKEISYLLIETGWYKLVVLDLKAGATVDLDLQYTGGLSCQAQFANSEQRLAHAVSVVDGADSKGNRQFSITVTDSNVTIESPQLGLRQSRCCASDRPDPEHERSY